MISLDLAMLVVGVTSAVLAVVLFICFGGHEEDEDDPEAAQSSHARRPPLVEPAQIMAVALLVDHVSYPRGQNEVAGGENNGSTEETPPSSSSPEEEEEHCAICLAPMEGGEWCSVMPGCRHEFHRACIAGWLLASNNSTCPLCRAHLRWLAAPEDMV